MDILSCSRFRFDFYAKSTCLGQSSEIDDLWCSVTKLVKQALSRFLEVLPVFSDLSRNGRHSTPSRLNVSQNNSQN